MKTRTLDQVESMKAKAVRFVRDVLGDDDRAEEIEDESPEDYAERKRITISNPQRKRRLTTMPAKQTKAELEERLRELEDENEELQDRLDQIATLSVADEEDEEDDSDDDEDRDDYDDDEENDLGED